ncbi:wax ester/triacylglycerol synthase domain-containing protein [Mycolicibacterium holsaticum]|nr:wax ester/triacylglycerol synthase domain-containing protein [Mycolicibacterium holsaticum]
MGARRLATVDAQTYWMSARIPNDQFLLYGFAGAPADIGRALQQIRTRAEGCPELRLRVRDRPVGYPEWVSAEVAADRFVVHPPPGAWPDCLRAVGALAGDQLDPRTMAWRLHVFPGVTGLAGDGVATVAVLQVAHVLGDGVRSSALAALLFGRAAAVPALASPPPWQSATLPWRMYRAARSHRDLVRDTEAGVVAPQAQPRPALRSNTRPEGVRSVRTVIRHRSQIPGPTVTVGVLAAVSGALSAHLRELGDDPSRLGAEVPMATGWIRTAHNHFGNVGVDLHPEATYGERTARIAAELEQRRRRSVHPAMLAASRASAAVPAALLRWGVRQFDPTLRSPTVTGNTVLSSVNRGPADLRFGDVPVALTAGYPALSPMMGVTHGVHGIGDTVAISVHAAESSIGDIDAYVERLSAVLRTRR